jgi:hypothetical protein
LLDSDLENERMPLEGFVETSLAAEPLLAFAVADTSDQHIASELQSIVQGMAPQPGVAFARNLPAWPNQFVMNVFLNPCRLAGFAL